MVWIRIFYHIITYSDFQCHFVELRTIPGKIQSHCVQFFIVPFWSDFSFPLILYGAFSKRHILLAINIVFDTNLTWHRCISHWLDAIATCNLSAAYCTYCTPCIKYPSSDKWRFSSPSPLFASHFLSTFSFFLDCFQTSVAIIWPPPSVLLCHCTPRVL